jgi:bifunctional UDP-N-acetylglucosamine pyrophosphorylase / glucosamine-1-phosphate N-acetyltransferase
MTNFSAIILAAGKGSRMKSALPKPLHSIAHKPMLGYAIDAYKTAGAKEIVVVISAEDTQTAKLFPDVTTIVQREQKGTAHAALAGMEGLKEIPDRIIMAVGDMPFIQADTVSALAASNDTVTVLAMNLDDPRRYGRLVVTNGKLEKIVEYVDATEEERQINLCNSGTIALKGSMAKELLSAVQPQAHGGEYYATDVVAIARSKGENCDIVIAELLETSAPNSRIELADLERMMQEQLRKKAMANGVTLLDPNSVYFSSDTQIGQDVIIEPNVFFGPGVVIGDHVRIKAFSHIEHSVIKNHAQIGPFARLRDESSIGEYSKIGNFVEISKSVIGENTKIQHHSYFGHSSVGSDVNVGAGTITCNYNGFYKSATTVGDNSFIGCNTLLVAPVTVSVGAMTAAGSVITQDVSADALAIARAPQVEKAYGAVKYRDKKSGSIQ